MKAKPKTVIQDKEPYSKSKQSSFRDVRTLPPFISDRVLKVWGFKPDK